MDEWYWCLKHSEIELREGCAARWRLGPYLSRAEALEAIPLARARTIAWDAEDEAWDEWESAPATSQR